MGCWAHLRGVVLPFDPKPIQANFYFNLPFYYSIRMLQVCMFSVLFSSIGSHTNYSTKSMRNKGGYEVIKKAIEKPGLRHIGQIAASVEGNGQRLADRHETSDINTFKWARGKGNNFLATQVLLLYLSSISFLTSCLIDRVLLIMGLPFVFNNEQYAL